MLTVAVYLGITAEELPALWGRREMRGELWTASILLAAGLALAIAAVAGYKIVSVWNPIVAIYKPIGTLLFSPEGS